MDLRILEDFISLAQTRSFSRSAEERRITQPAFSRRIKALELWLGTSLVDRSTYPTTLTPAGRLFRATAEEVLRSLNIARQELADVHRGEADTISVAALHVLSLTFFPHWIKRIEDRIGSVKCRLLSDNMHNCVQALAEGDSDLLLCFTHPSVPVLLDPSRFPSVRLGDDTVLPVSLTRDGKTPLFPLPGRPDAPVSLLAFAPDSFLGRALDLMIRAHRERCHFRRTYENSFTEALKMMALAGHGCAWLPQQSVRDELAAGTLVRAGPPSWDLQVDIRLFRALDKKRPQVEKLWAVCTEGLSAG
jgi:LysR family transcriptional regulator, hypochlorite-specific transcription factor HypT